MKNNNASNGMAGLKNIFTNKEPGRANEPWGKDLKNLFIEFGIPQLVKFLVDKIPDMTYEKFVMNYQKVWDAILPGFSFAILRAFNSPEIVDEITTEILASTKAAFDDRTGDIKEREANLKKNPVVPTGVKSAPIKHLLGALSSEEFVNMLNSISGLDEEQRVLLMNTYLDLNQRDALAVLKNASALAAPAFKLWADGVAPKPTPKVPKPETKIEKFVKDGLKDLGTDAKGFLGRKSWLEKLAENVNN